MSVIISVSDLITQVRQGLDEYSTDSVSDTQIISQLNRAQRQACNIVARRYEDAFLTYTTQAVTSASAVYDFPEECFGGRIEMIEWLDSADVPYPCQRITYRQGTALENQSGSTRPSAWTTIGRQYRLYPAPSTDYTVRVWYVRQPATLTKDQGRITGWNATTRTVTVDSLGVYSASSNPFGLETASDRLNNYFSVIDAQTGKVKGSLQATTVTSATNTLVFSAAPTRTSVLNRTVSATLPTDVAVDDFICNIRGSAVSELPEAYHDYLVEYAVCHTKRALGDASEQDFIALGALENELEKIWTGRENTRRVTMTSRRWAAYR